MEFPFTVSFKQRRDCVLVMMIGERSWCLGSWIKSPIIDLCLGWSREEVQSLGVKDFDSPREERNGITGRQRASFSL